MKRPLLLSMICLAWSGGIAAPSMAAQPGALTPVLVRDLKDLGAWAQWTRRAGYCTLQIILLDRVPPVDRRAVINASAGLPPPPQPRAPATQAWLLRADGTTIPVLRRATELPKNLRETAVTYTYAFPESASKEAAAVAVMIDGKYFVERLEPFPDEK